MTSDLPFDSDDTDAADRAGDTAYRVATGVARVARAGAYVTGGALVATSGGTAPAPHGGGQRLDSWTSAWTRDPEPDVPSPVVTFPDPEPNATSSTPVHSTQRPELDGHGAPQPFSDANPLPFEVRIGTPPEQEPWSGGGYDQRSGLDFGDDSGYGYGNGTGGFGSGTDGFGSGTDAFGTGTDAFGTGTDAFGNSTGGSPLAFGSNTAQSGVGGSGFEGTEFDSDQGGFGLPGHGLGQAGHGFGLPGANGFVPPGANPFELPRIPAHGAAADSVAGGQHGPGGHRAPGGEHPAGGQHGDHATEHRHGDHDADGDTWSHDLFDGVGNPDAFGVFLDAEAGFSIHTELDVDFGVGPDGMYLSTQSKIEIESGLKIETGAGRVGDNIDKFSDWLGSTPGTNSRSGLDHSGTSGQSPSTGISTQPAGAPVPQFAAQPAPVPPAAMQPMPVSPAPQPFAAPVAPAPPAPMVQPAAAIAAPVAATPLQTTIQPDAATTPIANVLGSQAGPSPLTAPAAAVPALFDQQVRPTPAKPVVDDTSHPTTSPLTNTPTTVTKTVPVPVVTGEHPTTGSHPTKTPDIDVTKLPGAGGVTTVPDTDIGTKTPGATTGHGSTGTAPTSGPNRPSTPITPDDDVPTPGTGGNSGGTSPSAGGGTSAPSAPSTHTPPTADIPSVEPTVSIPTMTHSVPTHAPTAPTVDIPTAHSPAPAVPPTHAPIPTMPNPLPVKPHPIAADLGTPVDYSHPLPTDHGALTMLADGGLSAALLPDAGVADAHHLVPGGLDITLI